MEEWVKWTNLFQVDPMVTGTGEHLVLVRQLRNDAVPSQFFLTVREEPSTKRKNQRGVPGRIGSDGQH